MYTVESLEKKFSEHSEMLQKENKKWVEDFKETHPNEEVPAQMLDDFDFPAAMSAICSEILKLKKQINK